MTDIEDLPVQIGQVKIGRAGQSLNAILGSCIGLGFLLPSEGVYGLAHALLANSDGKTSAGGGRHVDEAIRTLKKEMGITELNRRKLRVFLAGGANMTMPKGTDPKRLVGAANAEFAKKAVRAAGLRLSHEDMGGECGRRVTVDCNTGEFTINKIPRLGD